MKLIDNRNVYIYWGAKDDSIPFYITDKPFIGWCPYNHRGGRAFSEQIWESLSHEQRSLEIMKRAYNVLSEGADFETVNEQINKVFELKHFLN